MMQFTKRSRKIVLWLVFLAILLVIFLPGYNKLQSLRAKNEMLRKRIEELKESSLELEQEITKLKTDPVYAEKVAREELGVVREGEIIYKFLPPLEETEGED